MGVYQAQFLSGTPTTVDYTPTGDVSEGVVVVISGFPSVIHKSIPANNLGARAVGGGIYLVDKPAGDGGIADLQAVYWDDANDRCTAVSLGNPHFGFAVGAAASAATSMVVYHDPGAKLGSDLMFAAIAASAAVTNTTAETNFDQSYTIPANTLQVGDVIRVRAQAVATATNSTDTLNVRLKLGTTTILATGAVDVANGDIGYIEADVVIRTIGGSGTLVGAGSTAIGAPGTVTAKPAFLASTAVDTTAALVVAVSAQWSVANAGNSCRLDVLNVQTLRR